LDTREIDKAGAGFDEERANPRRLHQALHLGEAGGPFFWPDGFGIGGEIDWPYRCDCSGHGRDKSQPCNGAQNITSGEHRPFL
jgi:hypothetical protein